MILIGIDTNVLLRLLIDDDGAQTERVLAFCRGLGPDRVGYISLPVLLEVSWALRESYRFSKNDIILALRHILGVQQFSIEHTDSIVKALEYAEHNNGDIADALIAAHYGELGCAYTVTFDKKAAKSIPGMELLA